MAAEKEEFCWRVIGFCEKVYQAAPGCPVQPGGCCENCGQGIRYVVRMRNQFGQEMSVGQDCAVTMQGGVELREIRAAERKYRHEQWLASPEYAARRAEEAILAAKRAESASNAEEKFAMLLKGLRMISKSPNVRESERKHAQDAIESVLNGCSGPRLAENDEDENRSYGFLYLLASLPVSKYVGSPGKPLKARALLEALIPFATQYGQSYVNKFRCEHGALLVWFSKGGNHGRNDIGKWVNISGTVKSHENKYNEEQTVMTRCKVEVIP